MPMAVITSKIKAGDTIERIAKKLLIVIKYNIYFHYQEARVPGARARVRRVAAQTVLQADHRGREGQVLGAALAGAHQVSHIFIIIISVTSQT